MLTLAHQKESVKTHLILSPCRCFGVGTEITYSYTTVVCTLAGSQTQRLEDLEEQETAPATDDRVLCDLSSGVVSPALQLQQICFLLPHSLLDLYYSTESFFISNINTILRVADSL